MSEQLSQNYEIPREELFATAEQLFSILASEEDIESRSVNLMDLLPVNVRGYVDPEIEKALWEEFRRQDDASRQRANERTLQLALERKQRSLAERALDIVKILKPYKPATSYSYIPRDNAVNDVQAYEQEVTGEFRIDGEDDWPGVAVTVTRAWYEGDITVNEEVYSLDPEAKSLEVTLAYPDDEANYRFFVKYSVLPYKEGIKYPANYELSGYGRAPFTNPDRPVDPSVYMKRAMELLIEKHRTTQN